eukprot:gene5698-6582_t
MGFTKLKAFQALSATENGTKGEGSNPMEIITSWILQNQTIENLEIDTEDEAPRPMTFKPDAKTLDDLTVGIALSTILSTFEGLFATLDKENTGKINIKQFKKWATASKRPAELDTLLKPIAGLYDRALKWKQPSLVSSNGSVNTGASTPDLERSQSFVHPKDAPKAVEQQKTEPNPKELKRFSSVSVLESPKSTRAAHTKKEDSLPKLPEKKAPEKKPTPKKEEPKKEEPKKDETPAVATSIPPQSDLKQVTDDDSDFSDSDSDDGVVCAKMAIRYNIEAKNYGVAARLVDTLILLPSTSFGERDILESQLSLCKENGCSNQALPMYICPQCKSSASFEQSTRCSCSRPIRWCFLTYEIIKDLTYLQCNFCSSTYSINQSEVIPKKSTSDELDSSPNSESHASPPSTNVVEFLAHQWQRIARKVAETANQEDPPQRRRPTLSYALRIALLPFLLSATIPFFIGVTCFLIVLSVLSLSTLLGVSLLLLAAPFFVIGIVGLLYVASFLLHGNVRGGHRTIIVLAVSLCELLVKSLDSFVKFVISASKPLFNGARL